MTTFICAIKSEAIKDSFTETHAQALLEPCSEAQVTLVLNTDYFAPELQLSRAAYLVNLFVYLNEQDTGVQ